MTNRTMNLVRLALFTIGLIFLFLGTGVIFPALISTNQLPLTMIILLVILSLVVAFLFCYGAIQVTTMKTKRRKKNGV